MATRWKKIIPLTICILVTVLLYINSGYLQYITLKGVRLSYIRPAYSITDRSFPNVCPYPHSNFTGYKIKTDATCKEIQNLAFLKVHKTGSTTTANFLRRFAIRNNLNTVLMNRAIDPWILGNLKQVVPLPAGEYFNFLDIDTDYSRKIYQMLIPHCQFYLGILREPVSRYISFEFDLSFHYRHIFKRNRTNVYMFEDPFGGDPRSLEQQMSVEFGLPREQRFDDKAIREHLKKIDGEFDFVIIHEYYDESLLILRRLLCWQLRDVIYIISNKNAKKDIHALTPTARKKLEAQLHADVIFYDHFKTKLLHTISSLGVEFMNEVSHFRRVLSIVSDYCVHGKDKWPQVDIEASKWNPEFSVSKSDCELMLMIEGPMVKMMIKKALDKYEASKNKPMPPPKLYTNLKRTT